MKYIELFKNGVDSTIAEKIKPENWPYVGYSPSEGFMFTEIRKEGEIDPTEGFVDLGLSVMWASCNLGASSPYDAGTKHAWSGVTNKLAKIGINELLKDPVYLSFENDIQ